jgi:hypothetical protein
VRLLLKLVSAALVATVDVETVACEVVAVAVAAHAVAAAVAAAAVEQRHNRQRVAAQLAIPRLPSAVPSRARHDVTLQKRLYHQEEPMRKHKYDPCQYSNTTRQEPSRPVDGNVEKRVVLFI